LFHHDPINQTFSDHQAEFFQDQLLSLTEENKKAYAKFYGTTDIKDYSVFSLILLRNFDLIVNKIVERLYEINQRKATLIREIRYVPDPTTYGYPLLKNNNIGRMYKNVDSNFSFLENRLNSLLLYRDLVQSSTAIFIQEDIGVGRDGKNHEIDFIKNNLFISPIMQIFQSDLNKVNQIIAKISEEIARLETEMEKVRAEIDVFYGMTSGIAIFDVFAILWALFEIDKKYLLGLLNDQQFENYQAFNDARGFTLNVERADITSSYVNLEKIVIEKLDLLEARALEAQLVNVETQERTKIDDDKVTTDDK